MNTRKEDEQCELFAKCSFDEATQFLFLKKSIAVPH